jgi:hypothetical protein
MGQTSIFFPDHVNIKTINAARDVCRDCPLYDQCVAYWLPRYDEQPHGILFGYTERQRRLINDGHMEYRDWRQDGRLITKSQLGALEKKALEEGVPEVVDVYRIYEIEDQTERLRIMEAYRRWCTQQRYHTTVSAIQKRFERLTAVVQGAKTKDGRRLAIPMELRPHCPNGHGQKNMSRFNNSHGRRPNRWTCYLCRATVEATPEELVADELRRSA